MCSRWGDIVSDVSYGVGDSDATYPQMAGLADYPLECKDDIPAGLSSQTPDWVQYFAVTTAGDRIRSLMLHALGGRLPVGDAAYRGAIKPTITIAKVVKPAKIRPR